MDQVWRLKTLNAIKKIKTSRSLEDSRSSERTDGFSKSGREKVWISVPDAACAATLVLYGFCLGSLSSHLCHGLLDVLGLLGLEFLPARWTAADSSDAHLSWSSKYFWSSLLLASNSRTKRSALRFFYAILALCSSKCSLGRFHTSTSSKVFGTNGSPGCCVIWWKSVDGVTQMAVALRSCLFLALVRRLLRVFGAATVARRLGVLFGRHFDWSFAGSDASCVW
ncbi:uncharacterized protein J3D65DRAFT_613966 [Phyllosticta citribraziliensis]|uniref:Uncharacterized protein n=1 Tax=Phyllosticta citribraziliensis TaxID=989973 RepID=A0ABR1M6B3_9PEZI